MHSFHTTCSVNCRPSGTEDVVRVYAEAETQVHDNLVFVYVTLFSIGVVSSTTVVNKFSALSNVWWYNQSVQLIQFGGRFDDSLNQIVLLLLPLYPFDKLLLCKRS